MADPVASVHEMQSMGNELWDVPRAQEILAELVPTAAAVCCSRDCQNLGPDGTCVRSFGCSLRLHRRSLVLRLRARRTTRAMAKAMNGPDRELWKDAMHSEIANFTNYDVFEEVSEDSLPSWDKQRGTATEVIDMMWVLVKKYNELREFIKCKARGTVRGDQGKAIDLKMDVTPAETYAPTVRHSTCKMITAAACVRAHQNKVAGGKRAKMRFRTADATAAFLQGNQPGGKDRYVRPPPGYRMYDRRGVPIVWRLKGNCYGTENAPRVWFETVKPVCWIRMSVSSLRVMWTLATSTRLSRWISFRLGAVRR